MVVSGVARNLNVGENSLFLGTGNFIGNLATGANLTSNGILTVVSPIETTAPTNGAVVVVGGIGVSKSVRIGAQLAVTGSSQFTGKIVGTSTLSIVGQTILLSTADSTNASTGALVCLGGIATGKNIYALGDLTVGGSSLMTGQVVLVNTVESTSVSTGAMTVSGGVGITRSVYIGQNITVNGAANLLGTTSIYNAVITGTISISSTVDSTSSSSGSLVLFGGLGALKNASIGGNLVVGGNAVVTGSATVVNVLNCAATTESTSANTGAIVAVGGIALVKALL